MAEFHKSYVPQSTPHFSAVSNTSNHNDMPKATNILLYNYSLQSETLGDTCLIAVLFINYNDASFGGHCGEETIKEEEEEQDLPLTWRMVGPCALGDYKYGSQLLVQIDLIDPYLPWLK